MNSNSTDFTAADGRRFAFPVGVAFLLLAALLFWRQKETLYPAVAALGGALLLAGLIAPGLLGPIYRAWMKMALWISRVTTPVFLGLVYFLVITPTGLIMRLFGRQLMRHPLQNGGFWQNTDGSTSGDLRRQF